MLISKWLGFSSGYKVATENFLASCVFGTAGGKKRALYKKDWPVLRELISGFLNVLAPLLMECSKIVFPPLHVKLGIMKQFVNALEKDGNCFKYICMKFPGLAIAKLKAGIFNGPQIQKLINDPNFCNFILQN